MQPEERGTSHLKDLTLKYKRLNMFWSLRGQKGLRDLILSMTSEFLAIYCSYLNGFKNLRNGIELTLKSLFLPQNHKNSQAAEGFAPRPPL